MKPNEKRPDKNRSDNSFSEQHKDTPKLTKRQRKVYELLRTGKHSVTDITIRLGYCDPRAYIRDLRNKGICVADEWVKLEDSRYKKYFIK